MKLLLLAVSLVACVASLPTHQFEPITLDYHSKEGIPAATRIRQAEQALDFDGGRIAGGSTAGLGAYPHLVGLLILLTNDRTSVCGASLVSNTRLVTAAHCWRDRVHQGRSITAVLASTRLFSGGTRLTTTTIAMHGSYNPNTLHNDIAVITIPRVNYGTNIQPIVIPSGPQLIFSFEGSRAQVAGYGVTRDSEDITTNQVIRHVNVIVVNNLDCANIYGFNIIASTICTSGQGRVGPCGGDSGGPLSVTMNGQRILIGVVSFHAEAGCNIGFPGGYARVTSFASWIQARL